MGELFDAGRDKPYARRIRILKQNGVALWDVLDACVRPGSLDADIRDAEPNDFEAFLKKYHGIERIAFNGAAAERFFRRNINPPEGVELVRLPSTSPAYAALRFEQKLKEWRRALTR
jgi:TDG/mug DNA glycosylase family protein